MFTKRSFAKYICHTLAAAALGAAIMSAPARATTTVTTATNNNTATVTSTAVNLHWPAWSKLFGSTGPDWANAVAATPEGGCIFAGYTKPERADIFGDAWVVETDASGKKIFSKTYGNDNREEIYAIVPATGGGWLLAGETTAGTSTGSDAWLARIDSSGKKIWERTIGGVRNDRAFSAAPAHDGGYIIAGYTESEDTGSGDAWLLKINEQGNEDWQKTFGGPEADWAASVRQAPSGGYIAAGYTESYGAGAGDFWALRIDNNGSLLWSKTFGGPERDAAHDVIPSGSGFILVGETQSFGAGRSDFWIIKIDSAGREIWSRTSGGPGSDRAYSAAAGRTNFLAKKTAPADRKKETRTPDIPGDTIAIVGDTLPSGPGYGHSRTLLLDAATGRQIDDSIPGGDSYDTLRAIAALPNGGYCAAGQTLSFGGGGDHAWLLFLNPATKCVDCF